MIDPQTRTEKLFDVEIAKTSIERNRTSKIDKCIITKMHCYFLKITTTKFHFNLVTTAVITLAHQNRKCNGFFYWP